MTKLMVADSGPGEDIEGELLRCHQRIHEMEQDRERIKRDLHDGVLQTLYAVGLGIAAAKLPRPGPSGMEGQVDLAASQLDRAIREIRGFLDSDLGRQPVHEEMLERGIRMLMKTLIATSGIRCRVTIDPQAAAGIPKEHRAQILFILRESVSNALRHANPKLITVSLTMRDDGGVVLQVKDDGSGLMEQRPQWRGHGLKNILARVKQIGGQLQIHSSPGHGTRLIFELEGGVVCLPNL